MSFNTSRSRNSISPKKSLNRPSSQLGPLNLSSLTHKKNQNSELIISSKSKSPTTKTLEQQDSHDSILCLTNTCPSNSRSTICQAFDSLLKPAHPGVTVAKDGTYPVTAAYAKHKYQEMLTVYEITEINEYHDIYFLGKSISIKSTNGNFTQPNTRFYNAKVGDHIAYRYEILKLLGQGAFGQVFLCYDYKTKQNVALKMLINTPQMNKQGNIEAQHLKLISPIVPHKNTSSNTKSKPTKTRRISTSPSQHFEKHSNLSLKSSFSNSTISLKFDKNGDDTKYVVKIIDHFSFRNHVCIVTECLGQSLWDYMKARTYEKQQVNTRSPLSHKAVNYSLNSLKPLPFQQVKRIAFEVMTGLSVVHSRKIIHGDIKPENILFTLDTNLAPDSASTQVAKHVKIIDFGSSCKEGELVYNYIQSRFYRAPEVVLGTNYDTEIDIWSVGCIFCELLMGKPLFPAQNEVELLFKIIETIGQPPPSIINMQPDFCAKPTLKHTSSSLAISKSSPIKGKPNKNAATTDEIVRGNKFFSPEGRFLHSKTPPTPLKTPISSLIKTSDKNFIDFISKCLEWEKEKRITAAAALSHPWFQSLQSPGK